MPGTLLGRTRSFVPPGTLTGHCSARFRVRIPLGLLQQRNLPMNGASRPVGFRARLRTSKLTWKADETPRFTLDFRNQGKRALGTAFTEEFCEIEVDGAWYKWGRPADFDLPDYLLDPGKQIDGAVSFTLSDAWVSEISKGVPIRRGSISHPADTRSREISPSRQHIAGEQQSRIRDLASRRQERTGCGRQDASRPG
jgi:hypothetical protein